MDILKKINKLRMDKNWSVYRLSVESNIPQSTITNMFNRETLPSITTLEMLCQAFGISLAEFFTEEATDKCKEINNELYDTYQSLSNEEKKLIGDLISMLGKSKQNKKGTV